MRKSCAWYALVEGPYALGPFRFKFPITEQEFRAFLREWLRVKRLPQGTEVWPAQ